MENNNEKSKMFADESKRLLEKVQKEMSELTKEMEDNDIRAATGYSREEITQKAKRGEPLSMVESLVIRSTPRDEYSKMLLPGLREVFRDYKYPKEKRDEHKSN